MQSVGPTFLKDGRLTGLGTASLAAELDAGNLAFCIATAQIRGCVSGVRLLMDPTHAERDI